MTIFEEYLSSKREENKLEMNYLSSFHNCSQYMCDISKAKADLNSCAKLLKDFDEAQEKRKSIGAKFCDLSFITYETQQILPKFLKYVCGKDYDIGSLTIDIVRRVF